MKLRINVTENFKEIDFILTLGAFHLLSEGGGMGRKWGGGWTKKARGSWKKF